jgi:hypothetical protein
MPVPRVRFTVRRMMAAVVVVALLLWGGLVEIPRLRRLAGANRARAARHAYHELSFQRRLRRQEEGVRFWSALAVDRRKRAESSRSPAVPDGPPDAVETWTELATQAKDQAAWHTVRVAEEAARVPYYTRMKRKWERAARYPWLPVEPDPAPPE